MCKELLEIEPNSKWCLLTMVFIMTELKGYEQEILQHLEKLQAVDSQHQHYYKDYAAKLLPQK